MTKRKMRRRNPVARAVRHIRPKVVPSAKVYSRRPKHKGRSELIFRDGLFVFALWGFFFIPVRADARPRLFTPPPAAAWR